MPKLYFLEADKPLTKTFSATMKSSYPNVYEVTSYVEDISDVAELPALLSKHGALGRCLLKGALTRMLVHESRAGTTNAAAATEWLCLDLDSVDMVDTDRFMERIGLGDVTYVRQWSPSMGVSDTSGKLRCHIFVLCTELYTPQRIKHWLMDKNFTVPELAQQLKLSSTGTALLWTLDITTCQEDKLLYIAPPILLDGLMDPYPTNRYELVVKGKARATLPHDIPGDTAIRAKTETALNTLREAAGLPPRKKWEPKRAGNVQYLPQPDQATITGIRSERGFVYFNLNGGDSWAYFHPENNPYYIHNFKGEPLYRTEELLPAYWAELKAKSNDGSPSNDGTVYLVFRDFVEDRYYNVIYDSKQDQLMIGTARGEKQLRDFMVQHGQILPETIPDWNQEFDPSSRIVIDPARRIINTFRPSEIMKKKHDPTVRTPPPLTERVVRHICGYDEPTVAWLYNWLAFIVQYRQASGVAPVFYGTQGTGKGIFYHAILTPIFGAHNCQSKRLEELESEFFSGTLEQCLFVLVDEVQISALGFREKVTAKLKTLITEPMISVRKMHRMPKMVQNYCNFVFASNRNDPVEVNDNDRRFTIAPKQDVPLKDVMTTPELNAVHTEAQAFYSFLMNQQVDVIAARRPLESEAKQIMIETNRTTIDSISLALRKGNLQFFVDALPSDDLPDSSPRRTRNIVMRDYVLLVDRLLGSLEKNITRDELMLICKHCIGEGVPDSPHKFTAFMRHHEINQHVLWRNGRSQRGVTVNWNMTPEVAAETRATIAGLVDQVQTKGY